MFQFISIIKFVANTNNVPIEVEVVNCVFFINKKHVGTYVCYNCFIFIMLLLYMYNVNSLKGGLQKINSVGAKLNLCLHYCIYIINITPNIYDTIT